MNQLVETNSISIKIFNLLKNDILLIKLIHSTSNSPQAVVFTTILKVAKVSPLYKKDSKLDLSNYRPFLLLFNIENICRKINSQQGPQFLQ